MKDGLSHAELAERGITVREYSTLRVYVGTKAALVDAGVVADDQFPAGWMKSGGYKGYKSNPSQRWKVQRLRHGQDIFEVRRWHEPRELDDRPSSTDPVFARFLASVLVGLP